MSMNNSTTVLSFTSSTDFLTTQNESFVDVPFTKAGALISAVILLPLVVIGLVGNGITIYVIWRSRKLRSVFNLLIASLCVSDFLSALIAPLFLYRRTWGFKYWAIGSFLCKTFWGIDVMTSIATSFHILGFSFFRLISIAHPLLYKRIKVNHTVGIILSTWIISLGCGLVPFAIWMNSRVIDRRISSSENAWPSCTISPEWVQQFQYYTIFGYSLFFYCPMILIIAISVGVSILIWSRRKQRVDEKERRRRDSNVNHVDAKTEISRQKKENHAILQLALIVGSFMVGYIPHCAYYIITTKLPLNTEYDRMFHYWFGMVEHMLLRVSECLNPVFYNLASSKMRLETYRAVTSLTGRCWRQNKNDDVKTRRQSTVATVTSNFKEGQF